MSKSLDYPSRFDGNGGFNKQFAQQLHAWALQGRKPAFDAAIAGAPRGGENSEARGVSREALNKLLGRALSDDEYRGACDTLAALTTAEAKEGDGAADPEQRAQAAADRALADRGYISRFPEAGRLVRGL